MTYRFHCDGITSPYKRRTALQFGARSSADFKRLRKRKRSVRSHTLRCTPRRIPSTPAHMPARAVCRGWLLPLSVTPAAVEVRCRTNSTMQFHRHRQGVHEWQQRVLSGRVHAGSRQRGCAGSAQEFQPAAEVTTHWYVSAQTDANRFLQHVTLLSSDARSIASLAYPCLTDERGTRRRSVNLRTRVTWETRLTPFLHYVCA
jgi:hypothetical protein